MRHTRGDYNRRIQDSAGLIPEDEPVFLLRAQDRVASAAVRHWAKLNKRAGGDSMLTELAEQLADDMDAWPKKKRADL